MTPFTEAAFKRITSGFANDSRQRAWRLTGDYGSGKTKFLMVLLRLVSGQRDHVPSSLRVIASTARLRPIMATGEREPLSHTVLRALGNPKASGVVTNEEVITAVRLAVSEAVSNNWGGILLVLDELGKNLEYAVRDPDAGDVYLLQRLAEETARSGDGIFALVVALHQGFGAYAADLESTYEREWAKAAGRFDEIVFAHPTEQIAVIIHGTLDVDTDSLSERIKAESEASMREAIRSGMYGPVGETALIELASGLFPLHPTTLPSLVRMIRRFGQNERSLFGFMTSMEPFGLAEYSVTPLDRCDHYRTWHLFDYFWANMATTASATASATRWTNLASIVSSTIFDSVWEERVLKTVALFELLDQPGQPTGANTVAWCVAGHSETERAEVLQAIKQLIKRGALYERGVSAGLCLWSHSSVNLEEAFELARKKTHEVNSDPGGICTHLTHAPLVPRGHYVRTGTLRHVEVHFAPHAEVVESFVVNSQDGASEADLNLWISIPRDMREYDEAVRSLSETFSSISTGVVVIVAEPIARASKALADLDAWKWVRNNLPELATDALAREEVSRQIQAAERRFSRSLGCLANLSTPSKTKMVVFTSLGGMELCPGRELLAFLGGICDEVYGLAPRIHNELVNRRSPSSAAVAARTKLVESMGKAPDLAFLGMDSTKRPPEMALYLSVLQKGGLHVEAESGWVFRVPSPEHDTLNLLPTFSRISELLQASGIDAMVDVPSIFDVLKRPPYGIRNGLLPVVLAIYLATHHQRVAIYEDRTYVHELGGSHLLRMSKEPRAFHMQYCGLEGVRADVLPKLLHYLSLGPRDPISKDLLDLVRPLVVFISKDVPEFSRRTNRLSNTAISLREALLNAREPIRLVFQDLPRACGLPPILPNTEGSDYLAAQLGERIAHSMQEVRLAYSELIARLGRALCEALTDTSELSVARDEIAKRSESVLHQLRDSSARAFAVRLSDRHLADKEWIESLANLLARRSPERWSDAEEAEFHHQLLLQSGRFLRLEALANKIDGIGPDGKGYRIEIISSGGIEVCDVIRWSAIDEEKVDNLLAKIQGLLSDGGQEALIATVRALTDRLTAAENALSN